MLGLGDLFSIVCVLSCWFMVAISGTSKKPRASSAPAACRILRGGSARTKCTSHCLLLALITLVIRGCSETLSIFSLSYLLTKNQTQGPVLKTDSLFCTPWSDFMPHSHKCPLGTRLLGNRCQPALLLEQEYKGNALVEKSACIYHARRYLLQ